MAEFMHQKAIEAGRLDIAAVIAEDYSEVFAKPQ
jgi:hypothetical protein